MEIVAELTYNHLGDIDCAKKMTDAAKQSGATCVKFEIRNCDSYFRNNPEVGARKKQYEFSDTQIAGFVSHCRQVNIDWFASTHDLHSLKRLLPLGPKYIKVASREAREMNFLAGVKELNRQKLPVLISTGGLSFAHIGQIYDLFKDDKLTLIHTASLYPCGTPHLNMNRIGLMIKTFNCNVGYSGHEEGFLPTLYAISQGVSYIERHFTLDENMNRVAKMKPHFTDELCTLRPDEFGKMVNAINLFAQLKQQETNLQVSERELERINAYGLVTWDGNDIFLS